MHPSHMLDVAGAFGGSLFSAMHGSLVTSSFIRDAPVNQDSSDRADIRTMRSALGLPLYTTIRPPNLLNGSPSCALIIIHHFDLKHPLK